MPKGCCASIAATGPSRIGYLTATAGTPHRPCENMDSLIGIDQNARQTRRRHRAQAAHPTPAARLSEDEPGRHRLLAVHRSFGTPRHKPKPPATSAAQTPSRRHRLDEHPSRAMLLSDATRSKTKMLPCTAAGRTADDSAKVGGVLAARKPKASRPGSIPWSSAGTPAHRAARPDAIETRKRQVLDTPEHVFLSVFHIYAETEMAPWLHEVTCPCLVLTGELDGGCNPRLNRFIADTLPDSETRHSRRAEAFHPDRSARARRPSRAGLSTATSLTRSSIHLLRPARRSRPIPPQVDSRFRENDGSCINHGHVDGIIPASAGKACAILPSR